MPHTYFTHDDYVVNIIIKVMYFSQDCATRLYESPILSLFILCTLDITDKHYELIIQSIHKL